MYKYSILFLLFFLNFNLEVLGQNIDNCGKDDNPLLTLEESTFLQKYFNEKARGTTFDFKDKKILFVTGAGGTIVTTKSKYFRNIKEKLEKDNSAISTFIEELTDQEKAEFGYDAVITIWKNAYRTRVKKRVLKRIQKLETKK